MKMTAFKLDYAQLVGAATNSVWAQTLALPPFFLTAEMTLAQEIIASGTAWLEEIEKNWPKQSGGNLEELKKFLQGSLERLNEGIEVNLAALAVVNSYVYLLTFNKAQIIFKRQKQTETICLGQINKWQAVSGRIENGDVFVLLTKSMRQILTKEDFKASFDERSPAAIAELLAPKLKKGLSDAGAGAVIVKIQRTQIYPDKLKRVVMKASRWLRNKLKRSIYIRERKWSLRRRPQAKQKFWLSLAAIIALVLLISLGFSFWKQLTQLTEKDKEKLVLIEYQVKQARELVGLNDLQAKTFLEQAKAALEPLTEARLAKEKQRLLAEIETALIEAERIFKVEPAVFFDLSLIKEGGEGRQFDLNQNGQSFIWDEKHKLVYQLDLESKQSQLLASEAGGQLLAVHGETVYLLTDEGIKQIKGLSQAELVVKQNEEWGEIIDLVAYAGNLYLLDKANGQIFKYLITETGFSNKRPYLAAEIKPDFSSALAMAIDGSVWVLFSQGSLLKYTQGRPDDFNFIGFNEDLDNVQTFYTNDRLKNVYLLAQDKVIVFDKEGRYQGAYQWSGLAEATDLVVDEEKGSIWVLRGENIYEIKIKN